MALQAEFVGSFWLIVSTLLYAAVLYQAVRSAPWWHLRDRRAAWVLLAALAGVLLLWRMEAAYLPALSIHLLGATLLTLMFAWQFAVMVLSVVLLATDGISSAAPLNALLVVVLPVWISLQVYHWARRCLPAHFFVYIFVCAFFGAGLAMAGVIGATSLAHYALGAFSAEYLHYNYYRYAALIVFPEAFLTGMLMTVFVLYRPQWVSSFDDRVYLRNH